MTKTITIYLNNGMEVTVSTDNPIEFMRVMNEEKWLHICEKGKVVNLQVCNIAIVEIE